MSYHLNSLTSLHENFLTSAQSREYFELLRCETPWEQKEISLYGRKVLQPRFHAFYADYDLEYTYSHLTLKGTGWTPLLTRIKAEIENFSGEEFNSCLLNWYQDGAHSMGWHSDNEKELGPSPTLASLSLGETRNFQLRPKKGKLGEKFTIPLPDGSLLIMKSGLQDQYEHQIPKTKKIIGERINLTFRKIL